MRVHYYLCIKTNSMYQIQLYVSNPILYQNQLFMPKMMKVDMMPKAKMLRAV